MVCGKYFQGRGQNTHAYTHSVGEEHRVFLNLETKRFYCLPDNYEIIDPSLNDIIYVLNPTFTNDLIKKFETSGKGKLYIFIRHEKNWDKTSWISIIEISIFILRIKSI